MMRFAVSKRILAVVGRYRGGDASGHRQSQEEAAPNITPEVMAASHEGRRWGWGKVGRRRNKMAA